MEILSDKKDIKKNVMKLKKKEEGKKKEAKFA